MCSVTASQGVMEPSNRGWSWERVTSSSEYHVIEDIVERAIGILATVPYCLRRMTRRVGRAFGGVNLGIACAISAPVSIYRMYEAVRDFIDGVKSKKKSELIDSCFGLLGATSGLLAATASIGLILESAKWVKASRLVWTGPLFGIALGFDCICLGKEIYDVWRIHKVQQQFKKSVDRLADAEQFIDKLSETQVELCFGQDKDRLLGRVRALKQDSVAPQEEVERIESLAMRYLKEQVRTTQWLKGANLVNSGLSCVVDALYFTPIAPVVPFIAIGMAGVSICQAGVEYGLNKRFIKRLDNLNQQLTAAAA